jgi:hypothetical protein
MVLVLVLGLATVLRVLGLRTDLWMDELLSVFLVGPLESPVGVFTGLHHDNNHYLNSLWLFAVGGDARPWLMRLPALVLGILVVPLASAAVAGRSRWGALAAGVLVGLSYPLIHYSSEARGYAYVLFFALSSYLLFRQWLRDGRTRWALAYALSAALGFLAHLGFVTIFTAMLMWSSFEIVSAAGPRRPLAAARHAAVHALAVTIVVALYFLDLRYLMVEGGPPVPTYLSWARAAGLLAGSAPGWVAVVVAAAAAVAVLLELVHLYREREPEALFFTLALALPLLNAVVSSHAYRRYYLTALLFALLLLARFVARNLDAGRSRRGLAIILAVGFLATNLYQTVRFLDTGRGGYREAVAAMAAESAEIPTTVAGNHDLAQLLLIDYHAARLPARPRFVFYCQEPPALGCTDMRPPPGSGARPPEFFVLGRVDHRYVPPATRVEPGLGEYSLAHVYPAYGLSGQLWAVYSLREP